MLSYAKVNLGLRITGRRDDGYHYLSSIMALVSLCDEIHIEESNQKEVNVPGYPDLEDPEKNLAARALSLFKDGYKLTINKTIPLGAGLGGGSSNAGIILKKFNATTEQALSLGSDVPFFLKGGSLALIEGIGERVTLLDPALLPKNSFFILVPEIHCNTKTVYANFRGSFSEPFKDIDFQDRLLFGNDLEEAALSAYPELKGDLLKIRNIDPNAQLSGSGASVVSLPKSKTEEDSLTSLGIPFYKVNFITSLP